MAGSAKIYTISDSLFLLTISQGSKRMPYNLKDLNFLKQKMNVSGQKIDSIQVKINHTNFICFSVGIYLLRVNKRNTKTRCEICSKLTIKIPERHHCRRSGIFVVNFEHISHLALVVFFVNFGQ